MAELKELQEREVSEDYFVIACLGNVICTSEIGLHEAARDDLVAHHAAWRTVARQQTASLLDLDDPARLLDGRYVEQLPAATLIALLDFARADPRGVAWMDELRQALSKTTMLVSATRTLDRDGIDFAKKLLARDTVIESYVAHYAFLAERKMSASAFSGMLEADREGLGADLLWVRHASH